jgi:hypothetical protein
MFSAHTIADSYLRRTLEEEPLYQVFVEQLETLPRVNTLF